MSVANLRTGLAGQIGIATNALHDPTTIVTPTDFLEFESESVTDQPVVVRKQMIGNSVFARSGRVRTVDTGMANGATVHALLNTGYARLLRHIFGGYDFTWPGSTRGSATLTIDAVVTAADTMVIEGQTYTFRTALTASTTANEILIAGTVILQGSYIAAAINRGVASDGNGSGVAYGSLTPRNADVVAVDNGDGTVTVSDRQSRGVLVNSGQAQEVATTETFTSAGSVWDSATLVGGVNGTDTRNLHTYTVDPLALRELMATLQIVRPPSEAARVPWTYVGKPVSAVFAAADGDALMVTPTWDAISQTLATAIATASYPAAATFFDYTQISVTLDAVAEIVEGVSFTFDSQQANRPQMGSATRQAHRINGEPTITGELTREFRTSTIFSAWLAGTEAALVITSTGSQIPTSASNYQLITTIPDIRYDGATPNVGGPGVAANNIPFEALYDGSSEVITVQYYTDEGFVGDDG